MPSLTRFTGVFLQRCLLFGAIALLWWYAASKVPSFVLPGPAKVLGAIGDLLQSTTFRHDVGATMSRVFSGFAIAAVTGTLAGLILGSNRTLATFFEPILSILNTVSSAIWAIFAIIWFGISDATTVFVVFMTAFPLILTNVWQGTLAVDRQYVDLARSFRMSQSQILSRSTCRAFSLTSSLARVSLSVSDGGCRWSPRLWDHPTASAIACARPPTSCRATRCSPGRCCWSH